MDNDIKNFISVIPKVELHAHLNGSLTDKTLRELASIKYGETSEEYKEIINDLNIILSDPSLNECFKKFKIAHQLTTTSECLKHATLCVIRDFSEDNVQYLELRTTPKNTDSMTKYKYLETVLNAIKEAEIDYPSIIVKLIPSINRSEGVHEAMDTVNAILKIIQEFPDIIKGIDFSGEPSKGAFSDYKDVLKSIRNLGLRLVLHCGEIPNDNEISEMLDFGMDRCGHGTYISGKNRERLERMKIPLECCLSSNVKCGTVKSISDHHFDHFFKKEHPVVLCTDDFAVFDSKLSKEYDIARKTFSLSKEDLLKLTKNSINYSFASENEKIIMTENLMLNACVYTKLRRN